MAPRRPTTNATELAKTLRALRKAGRLSSADAALVRALETMAHELDTQPPTAAMVKVYTDALRELTAHEPDDGSASTLARIRAVPTAPRDSASA